MFKHFFKGVLLFAVAYISVQGDLATLTHPEYTSQNKKDLDKIENLIRTVIENKENTETFFRNLSSQIERKFEELENKIENNQIQIKLGELENKIEANQKKLDERERIIGKDENIVIAVIVVGTFRLTCVGDGTVLEVSKNNITNGVRLITQGLNEPGTKNQQWIGKPSGQQGGIVLGATLETALNTGNTPKVVDASAVAANETILWQLHGSKNQLWMFVPVQGTNYYVIRNANNDRCIRGSGLDNPVTLVQEDHKDVYQGWTYTLV